MPLRLQDIENYEPKKLVIKNISGNTLAIGDLKITLKKNEAQDLFFQNQFTKKRLRKAEEVYNSRDLDLLIVLGKVEVYTENGLVSSSSNAISSKRTADNFTEESELSNTAINMNYKDLTNPNITAFSEKFIDLGSVSGAVSIDISQALTYRAEINGATTISFTGWPSGSVAVSCVFYFVNGNTNVSFSGATFKFPNGVPLTFQATGEDRIIFQSFDNGTTIYGSNSGAAFGVV